MRKSVSLGTWGGGGGGGEGGVHGSDLVPKN